MVMAGRSRCGTWRWFGPFVLVDVVLHVVLRCERALQRSPAWALKSAREEEDSKTGIDLVLGPERVGPESAWRTERGPSNVDSRRMRHAWSKGAGLLVAFAALGCGDGGSRAADSRLTAFVPSTWSPVVPHAMADWSDEELTVLNAALYVVELSLPADDPRRPLLREAEFVPLDRWSDVDGPRPENCEAVFSMRTGHVYIARTKPEGVLSLASTLAHELHHMEHDRTESVNRMQEVDRERKAHACEAVDAERMLTALAGWSVDPGLIGSLELARAKARAVSAMYSAKFELFRVVQALDTVGGLKQMSELYRLYEECISLAQAKLSTDHGEEVRLLDALIHATTGTAAQEGLAVAVSRAREAVVACAPLQANVDELRARTGRR
jgi:hypothetical protein